MKGVGAEEGSSVTGNTFALIVKTKDDDSGKVDKANKLGVPIMTASEFKEKYF